MTMKINNPKFNDYLVSDEDGGSFDEAEEAPTWNLDEKLVCDNYTTQNLHYLDAKDFGLEYLKQNGFKHPVVFKDQTGLGLRVPSENFTVEDVKRCVGSKRIIDVMDVTTQKALTMTMKDWCLYYEDDKQKRERLLNVISLEFSLTKLESYVQAPAIVRQLDWIGNVWPEQLITAQLEPTNVLDKMKYPKVQKYCLMSVAGCYTDFHIDMGGSSVWYHVLKGEKIFWLIPPTDYNLEAYEKWLKSGEQHKQFLADYTEHSQRIVLKQGWTFMLPSGWIHAVYTPKDSIVFGGNFLHCFGFEMQLKVYQIENRTRVPQQFRFPFFIEMMWYVAERYVHLLSGYTYLMDVKNGLTSYIYEVYYAKPRRTFQLTARNKSTMTQCEYTGLCCIYKFLKKLSMSKRQVPAYIIKPDELLKHLRLVIDHYAKKDIKPDIPLINRPISGMLNASAHQNLELINQLQSKSMVNTNGEVGEKNKVIVKTTLENSKMPQVQPQVTLHESSSESDETENSTKNDLPRLNNDTFYIDESTTTSNIDENELSQSRKYVMRKIKRTKGSIRKRLRPTNVPRSNAERRRRIRCRTCEPCTRDDCGDCKYCKDMKKFGGQGVSKQCCLSKQCIYPLLPKSTLCMFCNMEIDRDDANTDTMGFECEICFEIYHAKCFWKNYPYLTNSECIINEDLLNSWQCAYCILKGYTKSDTINNDCLNDDNSIKSDCKDQIISNDKPSILRSIIYEENIKNPVVRDSDSSDVDVDGDVFTVESLTEYEKHIILTEFCEVLTDNDSIGNDNDENYCKYNEMSNSFLSNKKTKIEVGVEDQADEIYWKPLIC